MNGLLLQHAGEGDAFILPATNSDRLTNRLDKMALLEAKKKEAAAKAKAERDKKIDQDMKWNPDRAWYPHTEYLNNKVKDTFDYAAQLKMKGAPPTPDEERMLREKKWSANETAKKSADIQKLYGETLKAIEKSDDVTNKEYLISRLNDWAFGPDGKMNPDEVDFNTLNGIFSDPNGFNVRAWSEKFAKSLPETLESQLATIKAQGGDLIQDKEVKSKFFALDANGNYKKDKDGNPILNITPETIGLAMQEPRFKNYVNSELKKPENKSKTADDIVRDILSPYSYRKEDLKVTKGFSDKKGSDDDIKLTRVYDQERNFNLSQEGEPNVKLGWVPEEIRLDGKKMDKPIYLNAHGYIDQESNKFISNQIGDRPIKVTRLQKRPVAMKDHGETKKGQLLITNKQNILKLPSGVVGYKWFVEGSYEEEKDEPVKKILIPYEDVKPDLQSAYGIDLDEMGLQDPLGLKINNQTDPLGILK